MHHKIIDFIIEENKKNHHYEIASQHTNFYQIVFIYTENPQRINNLPLMLKMQTLNKQTASKSHEIKHKNPKQAPNPTKTPPKPNSSKGEKSK